MPTPPLSDALAREAAEAYLAAGSIASHAAKALGLDRGTFVHRLNAARLRGFLPDMAEHGALVEAAGAAKFPAPAVSHYWHRTRGENGEGISAFVRVEPPGPADAIAAIRAALDGYQHPTIPAPAAPDPELLNLFPLADVHLGLYSWARETGSDYNLSLAEQTVKEGARRLFARAAPAETCVILGLGDLFHANDARNVTPKSGHQLQVDGRVMKVFEVGFWLLIWIIDLALQTHQRVIIRILPGNHDPELAQLVSVAVSALYARESRVAVDLDAGLWWRLRHGRTLLVGTHGHNVKLRDIPALALAKWPEDVGATRYRYAYTGHVHHERTSEQPGFLCHALRAVTAPDAHSAGSYASLREMCLLSFSRETGRRDTLFQPVPMLGEAA